MYKVKVLIIKRLMVMIYESLAQLQNFNNHIMSRSLMNYKHGLNQQRIKIQHGETVSSFIYFIIKRYHTYLFVLNLPPGHHQVGFQILLTQI